MTDKLITDLTAIGGALADTTATEVMRSGQTSSEQALGSDWKTYIKSWIAKADVGLGNVDNTSDVTKNAASVTLTNKTLTSPVINTPTGIVKGDVGLGSVTNNAQLTIANNLSDLNNVDTARTNLGTDATIDPFFTDTATFLTTPAFGASVAAGTLFTNTLFLAPIWVPKTRTYTTYGMIVTTLGTGAAIRLGLYNAAGTKLDEAGTPVDASVATGATGLKTPAFGVNQSLTPGFYYIAAVATGTAPLVIRVSTPANVGVLGSFFSASAANGNTGLNRAFTYAALPASETISAYTSNGSGGTSAPFVGIR